MAAALATFHPAIRQWFAGRFAQVTPPQEHGWPAIRSGRDTLIAAPTGSGKTLAAFLNCIDDLVHLGLAGSLADQTYVLYVSPLKALSNDVQKNLAEPLAQVRDILMQMGQPAPDIRVVVRTGDTPSKERQAMTRKPPHILVTTPESLYILLTSGGGRAMLKSVRTVIVDEIHAVARDKRGSHLALTLERLDALTGTRAVRIGLSATQKPIEEVARFLVGTRHVAADGTPDCTIVNEGHARHMDLALELPPAPMTAVMSNDTWEAVYDRLADLIRAHRTTLVFTNTRRLAERVSLHLAKRLGEGVITSHHGSLSREQRLMAEQRLKAGDLRALVATASLELGIDIGTVDLVCQIGSPRSIATFLQRVGRSGHTLGATPRGRLFPLTRDDLVECAAVIAATRQGQLDVLHIPEKPLDIVAQQIVAAVAVEEWDEDALYEALRAAYPFRDLTRREYDDVVRMLADGYASRRGRSGAHLHYDGVNRRLRGRRGARIAAVTSGGAIPDMADYKVVLEPQGTPVGTVNEDFAIESMAGDIFQLGISSWRILRVEQGTVRVEDAHGQPPTIPFWLGEAPSRTAELSAMVSWLRREVDERLEDAAAAERWLVGVLDPALATATVASGGEGSLVDMRAMGAAPATGEAARQIVEYFSCAKTALGAIPTQDAIVLERFFDESGGMQLVLHAPFGGRINRAWGLSLRKKFCRTFNQELQAAATEDAIVLSLGPQHSFPLADVFSYLHSASTEQILVQALLAAPMFQTRWRWNVTRSLAVLRMNNGKRVPFPLQRMRSGDMLAAAFPDQVACAENIAGEIKIPDHPIVQQTVSDCLHEAMDIEGLLAVLHRIESGQIALLAKDTVEPSPLAHEILNAKPYAFLDDAPLEERRTQAVMTRRTLDPASARDLAALDPEAIALVASQAWPEPQNADEVHDALVLLGYLTQEEAAAWPQWLAELAAARRATLVSLAITQASARGARASAGGVTTAVSEERQGLWVAAERLPLVQAVLPDAALAPRIEAPARERERVWTPEDALKELLRGRLEGMGPVTAHMLAAPLGLPGSDVDVALVALEADGFAIRGQFSPGASQVTEWCDRRLLARIHRYTLDRLRREIEPATAAQFMRFLFAWQHADPDTRVQGPQGLAQALQVLQGFQVPAGAWENAVLSARANRYSAAWLDELSLSGQVAWGRLFPAQNGDARRAGPTRASPIAIVGRNDLGAWLAVAPAPGADTRLGNLATQVRDLLAQRGACFFQDIVHATRRLPSEVRHALGELVAAGIITGDGFAGLRGLIAPPRGGRARRDSDRTRWVGPFQPLVPAQASGRWSLLRHGEAQAMAPEAIAEFWAWQLLRRYGVVFYRMLWRESGLPPWIDLLRVLRRLEARGEIRGGRFVAGFPGEQYALPQAVESLRAIRRKGPDERIAGISAADPLNLAGIVTPGERVPAIAANRIAFRDGVPIAARVAGAVQYLTQVAEDERPAVLAVLRG